MYEGSMYGAGLAVFAVWGYVITHIYRNRGHVELNNQKLADTLGGDVSEIEGAIRYLMNPDPCSRFKEHGGRRLIKEGEYQYFVPSWKFYKEIRDQDERREYNRIKQAEYRARQLSGIMSPPTGAEVAFVRKDGDGEVDLMPLVAATGRENGQGEIDGEDGQEQAGILDNEHGATVGDQVGS